MVVGIRQTSSAVSTISDCCAPGVGGHRLQGDDGEQEDDRQRGEQDGQRDLVRRLLPRRALDQRDHPVDEGLAGLGGDLHDDPVRQHGGAAGDRGRSPPDSRTTGADSPVMADSSTVAMPSTTSPSPGMTSPASTTTRSPIRSSAPGTCSSAPSAASRRATVSRLGPAQRLGLRLAAALGDGLGEVREQHGEPQPRPRSPGEHTGWMIGDHGDEHRADPDHEHDRVARLVARVELAQRVRAASATAGAGRTPRADTARALRRGAAAPSSGGPVIGGHAAVPPRWVPARAPGRR